MLSIILSSYQNDLFNQFESSVKATVGLGFQYEIIKIDNPGLMGICEAYNLGASKARYPYLLFVHEDVQFETQDWGTILIEYLKQPEIGVVGLAGATRKAKMISSWYQIVTAGKDANRYNYKQTYKFVNRATKLQLNNPFLEKSSCVLTLDGLFLAIENSKFKQFKFDQILLKSFHGYDLDFSLNVATRYQNIVVYDILVLHSSEGKTDEKWFEELLLVHKKWMDLLPTGSSELTEIDQKSLEDNLFYGALNGIFSYQISNFAKLILLWQLLKAYKMKSRLLKRSLFVELIYKLFKINEVLI